MAKLKNKKKNPEKPEASRIIAYAYLLLMLGVFPLFYRNNYIDIMESKWLFFMSATLASAAGLAVCGIYRLAAGRREGIKELFHITVGEGFLLFFMGALLISWLFTLGIQYEDTAMEGLDVSSFAAAWDGSLGKLAGVFMYLMLFLAYVVVSRRGTFDMVIRQVYLWANFIVFSLAIVNHFMKDPLGMYVNLDPAQYWMFCSTMGNINVLSGYFAIFVPITVALFLDAKTLDGCWLYGLIMCTSFMGVVAANGDAGLVGLAAGFVLLLWYAMEDFSRLPRYFMALSLFFICAAVIGSMDQSFAAIVKEPLDTLPALIACSAFNRAAMILSLLILAVLLVLRKKGALPTGEKQKKLRRTVFIFLGLALLLALAVFFFFSVIDRNTDLGRWDTYLRFSDVWGSSRGFTWNRTMDIYLNRYDFREKLFGFGPDLMMVPYHTFYHEQIMEKMGAYLADAHSEFFQTLGTIGLTGVIGYFGFQICTLVRLLKKRGADVIPMAIAAGLVGYMVQGLLSSPQTFSTPVMFIMAGLGEMYVRKNEMGK